MHYINRYHKLIKYYQQNPHNGISEIHHIIPKCMGGTDDKSNLVALSPKAHYIAHYILYRAYPNNSKLAYALSAMAMNRGHRNFSAKQYEKIREAAKTKTLSEEGKTRISEANSGIKKPWLAKLNKTRTYRIDAFDKYHENKRLNGWTTAEIELKRKAGRARAGIEMSPEGRASIAQAARRRSERIVTCYHCGHTSKHSPNFFRYHNKNCKSSQNKD